ncbi:MAG: hypothetical protein H6695_01260 [Deferribacteres bacterium]|nr:hypothetical protein [Deferribacteres bacterium]
MQVKRSEQGGCFLKATAQIVWICQPHFLKIARKWRMRFLADHAIGTDFGVGDWINMI